MVNRMCFGWPTISYNIKKLFKKYVQNNFKKILIANAERVVERTRLQSQYCIASTVIITLTLHMMALLLVFF